MTSELSKMECVPCKGGVPPLEGKEIESLQEQLGGGWQVVEDHHLDKLFSFLNFRKALDLRLNRLILLRRLLISTRQECGEQLRG